MKRSETFSDLFGTSSVLLHTGLQKSLVAMQAHRSVPDAPYNFVNGPRNDFRLTHIRVRYAYGIAN